MLTPERLWDQLDRMLNQLLPVAEQCGVKLCMHPDDPPLPELLGKSRIMHNVAGFDRLMSLCESFERDVFLSGNVRHNECGYSCNDPTLWVPHSVCAFSRRSRQCPVICGNIPRQWSDRHGGRDEGVPADRIQRPHFDRIMCHRWSAKTTANRDIRCSDGCLPLVTLRGLMHATAGVIRRQNQSRPRINHRPMRMHCGRVRGKAGAQ